MSPRRSAPVLAALTAALAVIGVGAPGASAAPTATYQPTFDPASFVSTVDNPYFPLVPGSRFVYRGTTDAGKERTVTTVTTQTKEILGVPSIVVRDLNYVDGKLVESTSDWFAQDKDGNVWYMGEASQERKNGKVVSTKGSWEAGVDGAEAGIIMPAHPTPGTTYRQEYKKGEAEDMATILSTTAQVTVPAGSYAQATRTKDFSPLEPKVVEHKYYAPGVGLVLEDTVKGGFGKVKLIEHTAP
jgi:hypothetical protein